MSQFEIVYAPSNWRDHEDNQRLDKLEQLSHSAQLAEERDLEKSAERFRPPQSLLNAINAAIAARVPLLLTGEPGTGKTQVAWFLKRFFGIPLYAYQVHSNSQASDLRYDFDAVAYLRDAYLARVDAGDDDDSCKGGIDPRSQKKYLKPGCLWKAYRPEDRDEEDSDKDECVLLIDEIDKAPRDFPNDLLQELDQHWFAHPFHEGEKIKRAGHPPLIVITSNGERRLPDAFLRRCIVHHIELSQELLQSIMQAWESQFPSLEKGARELALQRFGKIRDNERLSKKPGAAELLLWLTVLSARNCTEEELKEDDSTKLPAIECLIKDHTDYQYLAS